MRLVVHDPFSDLHFCGSGLDDGVVSRLDVTMWSVIAFLITTPLRLLLPVLIAAAAYAIHAPPSLVRLALLAWTLVEIAFYGAFRVMLHRSQARRAPPPCSAAERQALFDRILAAEGNLSFLNDWFSPHRLENIGRDDLLRWLAWAYFDRRLDEVDVEQRRHLESMSEAVQAARGVRLAPGPAAGEPGVRQLLLGLDPVAALHRPLIYYAATTLMQAASDCVLIRACGFRRWCGGQHFVRRGAPGERAVVFVHGVGMGLATYLPFILKLAAQTPLSTPIVLLGLGHVSMRLHLEDVPTLDAIAAAAGDILADIGAPSAVWVGHSLGTFVVAAALRLRRDLVASTLLIDPVCLLLWHSDLIRNFCYSKAPSTPMQTIQSYHILGELWIAHYFRRHFCWRDAALFVDDLPPRARVFVARLDDIYHPERIIDHCRAAAVQVDVFERCGHGGWLVNADATRSVLEAIGELQGTLR